MPAQYDVEEAFDVFKNLLQVDTPYLRDDDTLRGYVFASFISLITYYRILKLLKNHDRTQKMES